MAAGTTQDQFLGIPGLLHRPRYKPQGFARSALIVYWVAGIYLAWWLGDFYWPLAHACIRESGPGERDSFNWVMLPFLIYTLPMWGFGYITVKRARIQRVWINSLVHLTWSASFMANVFYARQSEWLLPGGAHIDGFSWWGIAITGLVVFSVAERYTRPLVRVFYPEGRGHWAHEYCVFFSATPQDVYSALERGDAEFLRDCSNKGPTRVSHFPFLWPEQTTVVIISTCPKLPHGSVYLYLRTYWGYRFSQFMVRATILGRTYLHDVELAENDLGKLSKLVPGFTNNLLSNVGAAGANAQDQHFLGYSGPAANRIETPNGSWLAAVGTDEIRTFSRTGFKHPILMFALLILFLAFVMTLLRHFTFYVGTETIKGTELNKLLRLIPWIVLLYYELRKPKASKRMAAGVKSRRGRLFDPDAATAMLSVEPIAAVKRFKFTIDDYALARATRRGLDMEFSRFRAHLDPRDIRFDTVTEKDETKLAILVPFPRGQWRIVIDNMDRKAGKTPLARAQTLRAAWEAQWPSA